MAALKHATIKTDVGHQLLRGREAVDIANKSDKRGGRGHSNTRNRLKQLLCFRRILRKLSFDGFDLSRECLQERACAVVKRKSDCARLHVVDMTALLRH